MVACGIKVGDEVVDRASGRKGTVVGLSVIHPGVWVKWSGRAHARDYVDLDDIRLL